LRACPLGNAGFDIRLLALIGGSGVDGMTDGEKKLLMALVAMVHQHLHAYGDQVDNLAVSAGERAIQVLSDFGLMEMVNTRFGRWTEAGKKVSEEIWYVERAPATSRTNAVQLRGVNTRSLEELAPLAAEVATNADLLKRFEDVAFGDDGRRTYAVAEEIKAYVRKFDPSLTEHDSAKVVLLAT